MIRRLTSWIAAAGFLVVTVCACSTRQTRSSRTEEKTIAPITSQNNAPGRELATSQGHYVIIYSTQPAPIPLNQPFTMHVQVLDSSRAPVGNDVELQVDGRMPHHRHGMNTQPQVTRQSQGVFRVEGMLFHMPGRWELYFDISSGGRTERAQDVVMLE